MLRHAMVLIMLLLIRPDVPVGAREEADRCEALTVGQSIEEVAPGITLSWDDALICGNPQAAGAYEANVIVSNSAASITAVDLTRLALHHTTPRAGSPRETSASFSVSDLPARLEPGASVRLNIVGDYTTVVDIHDQIGKLNIHFQLHVRVAGDGPSARLPINVHLTPVGAGDSGDGADNGRGPPASACDRNRPGPPAWVCGRAGR